jgi:uncharacterized protein involved in type VI secretion and phage assembly
MPISLYDSGEKQERKKSKAETSIATGTVINNCDLIKQGKVLVRVPSLDQEVWARLAAPGAGSGAGMFYMPRPDDEVLLALNDDEPMDAFIIGGLWNTSDSPPISSGPEGIFKRIFKTGLKGGVGHEMEFDDAKQSIKITTTTKQQVTIDPTKIELTNLAGTVTITLDNLKQTVSIKAPNIEIGDTKTARIAIKGQLIQIGDSKSQTVIQGFPVKIN